MDLCTSFGGEGEFIRQFFKEREFGVAQCAFTKKKDGTEIAFESLHIWCLVNEKKNIKNLKDI